MNDNNIQYSFAAANSYNGFVSYFDEIFSPHKSDRIFILKGGPGTGKSRFIKDIIEKFCDKDVYIEGILCSSDPKSFDGAIIEKDGKKISIIDGTAPHATDPVYPGAVEKIINLGEFWNEILLKNNREKILELSDFKKISYKNAYEYLSVAKRCNEIVYATMITLFKNNYRDVASSILNEINSGNSTVKIRLKSAFGKQGFVELPPSKRNFKKEVNVVGIYGSEYFFINELQKDAKLRSLDYTLSPSPLDPDMNDILFFEDNDVYISTGNKNISGNATIVDTSKFIDIKKFETVRGKLESLYKEKESMLWCATDEFKKAADAHMETEKIYTASMNFKKNKKLLDKVCEEIKVILFPEDLNTNLNG